MRSSPLGTDTVCKSSNSRADMLFTHGLTRTSRCVRARRARTCKDGERLARRSMAERGRVSVGARSPALRRNYTVRLAAGGGRWGIGGESVVREFQLSPQARLKRVPGKARTKVAPSTIYPAPSPCAHLLMSGPPTLKIFTLDIHAQNSKVKTVNAVCSEHA